MHGYDSAAYRYKGQLESMQSWQSRSHLSWDASTGSVIIHMFRLLQATVQQAEGTSDKAPLKGTSQPCKGTGKQKGFMSSTIFALCALAVLLVVAAAGGITWYRAGGSSCLHNWHP